MDLRAVAAVSLCWLAGVAVASAGEPGERRSPKKGDAERRAELQALIALADAAAGGQPGEGDLSLRWEHHFLKGAAGRTYVPFSVAIDEHSRALESFAMYVRVVSRGGGGPKPADRAGEDPGSSPWGALSVPPGELPVGGVAARHTRSRPAGEASAVFTLIDRDRQGPKNPYDFEDVHFVGVEAGAARPYPIRRALAVPPGDYDVYVAVGERTGMIPPPRKTAVLRQRLMVPDFSRSELAMSSLIVAERVEPLAEPLAGRQQVERPYALGSAEIVPASDLVFTRSEEPSVVFQIYDAASGPDGKPDIGVEYRFQREADGRFVLLSRTPQRLNRETLPPHFDPRAGHQLAAVQSIPAASFSPGSYRLEITVTDNIASKSLTAHLDFVISDPPVPD